MENKDVKAEISVKIKKKTNDVETFFSGDTIQMLYMFTVMFHEILKYIENELDVEDAFEMKKYFLNAINNLSKYDNAEDRANAAKHIFSSQEW